MTGPFWFLSCRCIVHFARQSCVRLLYRDFVSCLVSKWKYVYIYVHVSVYAYVQGDNCN